MIMQIVTHADYTTVILPNIVAISGGADELKSAMLTLCDQHCKNIVLDFSSVTLLDSIGLGKILFVQQRLIEYGGGIKFINVKSEYLRKLFKLINLHKVIKIEDSD